MIKLAVKAMGIENVMAITDSIAGAGLPPGIYRMSDGRRVYTKEGDAARLVDQPEIIVGSTLTMNIGLKNLIKGCGLSLCQACKLTSSNPAKLLKLEKQVGTIEEGKLADLAVLDPNFQCILTLREGRIIFQNL